MIVIWTTRLVFEFYAQIITYFVDWNLNNWWFCLEIFMPCLHLCILIYNEIRTQPYSSIIFSSLTCIDMEISFIISVNFIVIFPLALCEFISTNINWSPWRILFPPVFYYIVSFILLHAFYTKYTDQYQHLILFWVDSI